jgi:hypothetical protein
MLKLMDGTMRVMIQGVERVSLQQPEPYGGYLVAAYEPLATAGAEDPRVEPLKRNVVAQFGRVIDLAPYLAELTLREATRNSPVKSIALRFGELVDDESIRGRTPAWPSSPSCLRPSRRGALSPPATPPGSWTARRPWCWPARAGRRPWG